MKSIAFICLLISLPFLSLSQSGITWINGNNISSNQSGNMHPRISLDRQGNPLVVWGRMSDAAVMFSKWNGSQFTTPVKMNPPWMTVASASWMGPDIATYGDTVYVVVKRMPEASDTNRVFLFTSFDSGNTFNTPVELAFIADSISRFPTVTTDLIGNPIVAFMKFNSSFLDSRWVVSRSMDFGNTFQTDVKASGWGTSAEVCDCCPGALVGDGVNYTMLYRNNNSNIRDTWVGISADSASSFTNSFAVDNNNWMIMSCPSSGPDGIIIGDTLYSTFMSAGTGNYRTYLSKSSITNTSLGIVENLTGNIPGLSQQNYPRIATDGSAAAIVWKQNVNGVSQLPIKFTNDILTGFSSSYDTVDLGDVTNTDIAMFNGNLWVVWEDDNSGTVKYRNGTYVQVGTSLNELEQNKNIVFPNPVKDHLHLRTDSGFNNDDVWEFLIYNSLGEVCMKSYLNYDHSIDVADLKPGLYLLEIISLDKVLTSKFIKQ